MPVNLHEVVNGYSLLLLLQEQMLRRLRLTERERFTVLQALASRCIRNNTKDARNFSSHRIQIKRSLESQGLPSCWTVRAWCAVWTPAPVFELALPSSWYCFRGVESSDTGTDWRKSPDEGGHQWLSQSFVNKDSQLPDWSYKRSCHPLCNKEAICSQAVLTHEGTTGLSSHQLS